MSVNSILKSKMSKLDNPKALFQATCSTNSEPYALQNIGDMMSPEFSENFIAYQKRFVIFK